MIKLIPTTAHPNSATFSLYLLRSSTVNNPPELIARMTIPITIQIANPEPLCLVGIIRSSLYYSLSKSFDIKNRSCDEQMPKSIKITCHECGRKVKAYNSGYYHWKKSKYGSDEPDEIYTYRIARHNIGLWFKPRCSNSGKKIRRNEGSRF